MKKIFAFFVALVTCATMWAEPITVRLKASSLPADWGDVAIYYWGSETKGWPGEKLTLKDGWYSKTFAATTDSINIIWNNNDNGKQTGNIEKVKSSTCYEINGGSGKSYTVATTECPEAEPEVSLTVSGTAFVDSTLTFSTLATNFSGTPTIVYSVKMGEGEYSELTGNTYTINEAGEYTVKAVATYNAEVASDEKPFTAIETPEPITVRLKASSLPSDWGDVSIYYWNAEPCNWPGEKLTEEDGWYSKTFKATTTSINIIWNNNDNGKQTGNIENVTSSTCYEISGGSGTNYTVKTVDCKDTVPPTPAVKKYYITGDSALVGDKAWNEKAIEMKDSSHTFMGMAAGSYKMKITDGTWGNSWGYAALTKASSEGITGDKDGNICFTVENPNHVVVSIANDSVTVTGNFKKEPAPEVHIYAKNNWGLGDWTWKEMEHDSITIYSLVDVFGGTGININDKANDVDALWFTIADIERTDTLLAGDTIQLVFNMADSTLEAVVLGRIALGVTVNVQVPAGTPTCYFYGNLSGNKFVEMTPNGENLYTITFSDKSVADLGWGYKFVWDNNNWNTQVSPETTYTVTDGSLIVIPGWQTNPTTALDAIQLKGMEDGKFIWNSQLVIRRNGVLYNATGARMK